MRPLTTTVNMSHPELWAWHRDQRHHLASTATGLRSLERLVAGDHAKDHAFAEKVDNFNRRHSLQSALFGREVGRSGWSKRAIALRNWGHDPSKPSSPLHEADREWLASHPGAEERRKGRLSNPIPFNGASESATYLAKSAHTLAVLCERLPEQTMSARLAHDSDLIVRHLTEARLLRSAGASYAQAYRELLATDEPITLAWLASQERNLDALAHRSFAFDYPSEAAHFWHSLRDSALHLLTVVKGE